jgi:hypothetical protein
VERIPGGGEQPAPRPKDLDALPELIDIARARDRAQNPGDR